MVAFTERIVTIVTKFRNLSQTFYLGIVSFVVKI